MYGQPEDNANHRLWVNGDDYILLPYKFLKTCTHEEFIRFLEIEIAICNVREAGA